jgi:hypothetical protein
MKKARPQYEKMNAAQLRDATSEFDRELPAGRDALPGRAMNPTQQRKWDKIHKKMGRPRIGLGVKRVMISLEAQLLNQSDGFARRNHLSRSQMISAGLRKLMAG